MIHARGARSSAPASTVLSARKGTARRGVVGVAAALAVVGFAGAMVAPTGMALAAPVKPDAPDTAYSAALADAQNITVQVEGAEIAPVERGTFSVYVTPKPEPTPEPEVASSASSPSSGGGGPLFYAGGGAPADWMAAAGIAEGDWGYVDYIVSKESGWNPNATNRSSGACGLVQAYPCSKVPGNGYDPVDNLCWGNGYAIGRYGSWAAAYQSWVQKNWW